MKNLKPTVVSALKSDPTLTSLLGGPRIYYQYPADVSEFPRITYYEADNKDYPFADELENATEIIMVVDIWNKGSTSEIADSVDRVMNSLGFYREFAGDLYEAETRVHHKTMRFRRLKVFDGDTSGVIPVDPWLEALAQWTEMEMGPGWTVYRNPYPEGYDRPAVIWIMTGVDTEESGLALYKMKKTFAGVVVCHLPMEQVLGAAQLAAGLRRDVKIPLDLEDRRYLTVKDVSADVRQDSLVQGRLTLELFRFIARPFSEEPLLQSVHIARKDVS